MPCPYYKYKRKRRRGGVLCLKAKKEEGLSFQKESPIPNLSTLKSY
jgi:hypothetical protein